MKPQDVTIIQSILRCNCAAFPITYLGLPLSISRPSRAHFLPIIRKMQQRIQGWQTKYLSLAGRLVLVKAVLSSMPLHFLQAIKLPKWVYAEMDKLRRSFLWKGVDKCTGGQCLVNWDTCSIPKSSGGLGIIHLPLQNDALLLRWLWKLISDPQCVWTKTISEIYGSTDPVSLTSSSRLSHSLKSMLHLIPLLKTSVLKEDQSQQMRWRWNASGEFTANSAYNVLRHPGCLSPFHNQLWKLKAPPKINFFLWLVLLNKILTLDNLQKRGWTTQTLCHLCNLNAVETSSHLFLQCPFARRVCSLINTAITPQGAVLDFRTQWQRVRQLHSSSAEAHWLAVIWNTWKECNGAIFQNNAPIAHRVASRAIQDATLWVAHY